METRKSRKEQRVLQIRVMSFTKGFFGGLFGKKERIEKDTKWVNIDLMSLISLFRSMRMNNMPFRAGDFIINRIKSEITFSLGGEIFKGVETEDINAIGALIEKVRDNKIDLFEETFVLVNDGVLSNEKTLKLSIRKVIMNDIK